MKYLGKRSSGESQYSLVVKCLALESAWDRKTVIANTYIILMKFQALFQFFIDNIYINSFTLTKKLSLFYRNWGIDKLTCLGSHS